MVDSAKAAESGLGVGDMNRSLHAGSGETGIRLVTVYGEVLPPPGDEVDWSVAALRAKGWSRPEYPGDHGHVNVRSRARLQPGRFLRNLRPAMSDIVDIDER
jgi:hypothetical protein